MSNQIFNVNDRGASARDKLRGLGNPREIQRQNLLIILSWLYRWGFSTADILSNLLGRVNRSHAKRLADDGWIRPVSIKGYPIYYVLTERGLAEAIRHSTELLEYKEADPYRVHLPTMHHYLVAQQETVQVLRRGWFCDFKTERMFNFVGDNGLLKTPDVLFVEKVESAYDELGWVDQYTAVEIELTPKWNHHLNMFVTNIIRDIQDGRIYRCVIISDSKAILARYEAAFLPGQEVKLWEKVDGGKVTNTGKTLLIPEWATKHVLFRQVGSTEPFPV